MLDDLKNIESKLSIIQILKTFDLLQLFESIQFKKIMLEIFSQISKQENIIENTKEPEKYTMLKFDNNRFKVFFNNLIEDNFIDKETSYKNFQILFYGYEINEYINWINPKGEKISELLYFIHLIWDILGIIKKPKTPYLFISKNFRVNNKKILYNKFYLKDLYNKIKLIDTDYKETHPYFNTTIDTSRRHLLIKNISDNLLDMIDRDNKKKFKAKYNC